MKKQKAFWGKWSDKVEEMTLDEKIQRSLKDIKKEICQKRN